MSDRDRDRARCSAGNLVHINVCCPCIAPPVRPSCLPGPQAPAQLPHDPQVSSPLQLLVPPAPCLLFRTRVAAYLSNNNSRTSIVSSISCSLCEFFIYARNRHRTGIPQRLVPVGTVPLILLTVINHVRLSFAPFPSSSSRFCGRRLPLPLALATCQPSQPASGTMYLPRSVLYTYNALTADLHSAVLPWQFVPNTRPTDRYLFRFDTFPLSQAHDLTFLSSQSQSCSRSLSPPPHRALPRSPPSPSTTSHAIAKNTKPS